MTSDIQTRRVSTNQFAAALATAVGLTVVFWWPMWLGDGVVGGDIMDYFFPQKVYLANALANGDIPLWNNLVALGYPFVADSQIAMWYPTTIPLYSTLAVETAFQVNVMLHYVLAFLFTWAYGRSIGLKQIGALLAALVFTYGWFPPRLSVEWAITTGCYLPGTLWCVERFLRTARRRWLGGLAGLLTLQLLAGHFSLTFINHVLVAMYTLARVTIASRTLDKLCGFKPFAFVLAMQVVAFPLAAAQLSPTWELRQQSQRGGLPIPEVADGRIPWNHLQQLVTPWVAYHNDMSEYPPPYTNGPAASLFIGILPFLLAVSGCYFIRKRFAVGRIWRVAIPIAIVFAVGWVTPIYQHLPGFGYFKIPGRYSLIAAIGLAILAGYMADRLRTNYRQVVRRRPVASVPLRALAVVAVALTLADLYIYGRSVAFTTFVPLTVDDLLVESELRGLAEQSPRPLRMLVPGNNALTCTGISAVPGFLGLAPEPYVVDDTKLPSAIAPAGPAPGELDRLRRAGVTHIIFEREFNADAWQVNRGRPFFDSFLTRVMDRLDPETGKLKPWHIGQLKNTRGRATVIDDKGNTIPSARVEFVKYEPDNVVLNVATDVPGRLVLTDLAYPDWQLTVDGQPAESLIIEEILRGVDLAQGQHEVEWSYRPKSIQRGFMISLATFLLLIAGLVASKRWRKVQPKPIT